jgi:hypothetical protein
VLLTGVLEPTQVARPNAALEVLTPERAEKGHKVYRTVSLSGSESSK